METERREKIRELLQLANVSSMEDIQNLFKDTIAEFMENGLEAELDDELGYSRYDYRNKETDNSRNGHSSKTLRTSFGDVEVLVPRDRKGEFEPRLSKKNQLSTYFKYPQEVRRLIYTTNTIEGFNRQLRKVTKAKSMFPTDDSLLKMLYLAMVDITKKWTGRRQD